MAHKPTSNAREFWQAERAHATKLNFGGIPDEPNVAAGKSRNQQPGLSEGVSKEAVLGSRFTPTTGGALQRTKRLPYPIPGES